MLAQVTVKVMYSILGTGGIKERNRAYNVSLEYILFYNVIDNALN